MRPRRTTRVLSAILAGALLLSVGSASAQPSDSCGPTRSERCELWTATHDGPGHGQDAGAAMAVSPFGDQIFVAGHSINSNDDFTTIAYDAAGGERWVRRFDGAGHGTDTAAAVVTDGVGVYVTGYSTGAGSSLDMTTVSYDAMTGEQQWVRTYDGIGEGDQATAIALSPSGTRVYVTGYSTAGGGPNYDGVTLAYDVFSGDEVWQKHYEGAAGFWDIPSSIAVVSDTSSERVAITMRSNVASAANDDTDFVTVAYDGDSGDKLWESRYDGPASAREYPYAITASKDKTRFFVTGESTGAASGLDYATVAYNSLTGAQEWASRYAGTTEDDRPLDIAASDDAVFVTGFIPGDAGNLNRLSATVAYDTTTGGQKWVKTHAFEGGEASDALVVSPDQKHVYVGGLTVGQAIVVNGPTVTASGYQALSLAAATGNQEWSAHLPAVGSLAAAGLSPNGGTLYVTGGDPDVVTAAYETGFPVPPPPVPTSIAVNPSVINAANKGSVTISGTARPGDWMIIALADQFTAKGCGKAAEADGSFSCTVDATSLPDGTLEARARAVDNQTQEYSDFIRMPVTKDTVVSQPTLTVANVINAANKTAVPVSGTAEQAASVTIALSDGTTTATKTVTTNASGVYSTTIDASTLSDGAVQATASQIDVAGNVSAVRTANTTKDTLAPAAPVILTPAPASTNPASIQFSGTAEPGSLVTVLEGTAVKGSATTNASGAWSLTAPFGAGARTAVARARDAAGNTGAATSVAFTVNAPPTPAITSPVADATIPASVTITGTGPSGMRIRVLDGPRTLGNVYATNGTWTLTTTLGDGVRTLSAVTVDAGGGTSAPSPTVSVTVDAIRPTVAISTGDRSVHTDGATIEGTANDERIVTRVSLRILDALGDEITTVDADCAGCGATEATWAASLELDPGAYTVLATAYDAAGNPSQTKKILIVNV